MVFFTKKSGKKKPHLNKIKRLFDHFGQVDFNMSIMTWVIFFISIITDHLTGQIFAQI
jgi:hypothetical protein